jgi:hypothetical protein
MVGEIFTPINPKDYWVSSDFDLNYYNIRLKKEVPFSGSTIGGGIKNYKKKFEWYISSDYIEHNSMREFTWSMRIDDYKIRKHVDAVMQQWADEPHPGGEWGWAGPYSNVFYGHLVTVELKYIPSNYFVRQLYFHNNLYVFHNICYQRLVKFIQDMSQFATPVRDIIPYSHSTEKVTI